MNGDSLETAPLLRPGYEDSPSSLGKVGQKLRQYGSDAYAFAVSKNGRGIFKCSMAYLLGSLVTFVPALAAVIGDSQDSKHMVRSISFLNLITPKL